MLCDKIVRGGMVLFLEEEGVVVVGKGVWLGLVGGVVGDSWN